MEASTTSTSQPATRSKQIKLVVVGVLAAPITLLLSGAVSVIYLTEGLTWLGIVLAIALVAVVVFSARRWPVSGVVAGGLLAMLMLAFAIIGTAPTGRVDLGFSGVIAFGSAGLLSAALVAAYLTPAVEALTRARR